MQVPKFFAIWNKLGWCGKINSRQLNLWKGQKMSNTYIAPGAHVVGKVTIGENVGIWYNAVVRGDME